MVHFLGVFKKLMIKNIRERQRKRKREMKRSVLHLLLFFEKKKSCIICWYYMYDCFLIRASIFSFSHSEKRNLTIKNIIFLAGGQSKALLTVGDGREAGHRDGDTNGL